jgi:elongation factor Tu
MTESGVDQTDLVEFQFEIEDVFLVEGKGTAISGLVELGTIVTGLKADIHGLHAKRHASIGAIVREGESLERAEPGHHCTLLLEDLTPGHIGPGMLVTHQGGERHKELRERCPRDYTSAAA